jgi:hypothetical protein
VETLPALLKIEEQLRSLLAQADKDAKSAVPAVNLDGYITFPGGKATLSKRDQAMSRGRVVQRELLSVMLQLLRGQKFKPLVESEMEKKYATALIARSKEDDLKDIKTPADAKAKGDDWLQFDPIHNVPIAFIENHPKLSFTPEVRNQVRNWAEEFLKTVPKEQWTVSWVK